jgi:hypothetical protein
MRKAILFSIIFLISTGCYAQTGALTIYNNAPVGCDITVTMYASTAAPCCSGRAVVMSLSAIHLLFPVVLPRRRLGVTHTIFKAVRYA